MNFPNPATASIKVLLVDDHPLVLDGIQARLEAADGIDVIGLAANGQQALERSAELQPDVVLMDVSMPVMNGIEASAHFQRDYPQVKVLILSMHDSREYIMQLMHSGARGYVLKDVGCEELIKAIETVYQGNTYFSQGASQSLFNPDTEAPLTSGDEQSPALTKREQTVLRLLAQGSSNKQIASELNISVRTVETHRQNIKAKLGIQTAAGLARYAIENNLVGP